MYRREWGGWDGEGGVGVGGRVVRGMGGWRGVGGGGGWRKRLRV